MNPKRIIILSSGLVLVLVGGAVFAQSAFAKTSGSIPNLAAEIAGKFHLNQSDVQGVIDQHRQEAQTVHEQAMGARLDAAVASGKITAAQKTAILAEITVVQQRLDTIRALTSMADRKAAMKQLQADVKTWAQQNGLSGQWIRLLGGRGR